MKAAVEYINTCLIQLAHQVNSVLALRELTFFVLVLACLSLALGCIFKFIGNQQGNFCRSVTWANQPPSPLLRLVQKMLEIEVHIGSFKCGMKRAEARRQDSDWQ